MNILELINVKVIVMLLFCFKGFAGEWSNDFCKRTRFNQSLLDTSRKKDKIIMPSNFMGNQFGWVQPSIGIFYEHVFHRVISLEGSLGLVGSSIGTKVYLPPQKPGRLTLYSGFSAILEFENDEPNYYVPFGVNYSFKNGFRLSFDAGPLYWYYNYGKSNELGRKIGFSFRWCSPLVRRKSKN
jgi:hypothetical protein